MDDDATVKAKPDAGATHPTAGELTPGTRLGDYRILQLLGRGGMGEVYEAEQERLRQRYALKVLPPNLSSDRDFRQRFEREAQVLAGLKHPHIVQIHYAGEIDGRFYLVMELLPRSLEQVRQTRAPGGDVTLQKLEPAYVRTILLQMLDGLAQAHGKGIIHRDLKPANILIDEEGRMKLADFGVARVTGGELQRMALAQTVAAPMAPAQTVSGTSGAEFIFAGTPAYMAPEVREGREADAQSDLYAVGVIAYELLMAQRPEGRFPDASSVIAGLDPRWDALIDQALQTDPAKRWRDATAMRSAVEKLGTPIATVKKPRGRLIAGSALAVVCLAGLAAWLFIKSGSSSSGVASNEPPAAQKSDGPLIPTATRNPATIAAPASVPKARSNPVRSPAEGPPSAAPVVPVVRTPSLPVSGQPWSVPAIDLPMVWLPAGEFLMGSPTNESERDPDEGPQTVVRFAEGLWLGKFEVTQAQWFDVMGVNPSRNKAAGGAAPVESISWDDAVSFCAKLSERERAAGCLLEGWEYSLPTEAQWEYASRAGSEAAAPTDLSGSAWYLGNGRNTTHPVGKKSANAWGLHDMLGNVWEWCLDSYERKLPGGTVDNWRGVASGGERVLRGGSVNNDAAFCRFANRFSDASGNRVHYFGLRLALVRSAK